MLRLNLARFSTFNNSSCQFRKSNVIFTFPLLHLSTSGEPQSAAAAHSTLYHLLVHKHHLSSQSASKIASAATLLRNPERSESVVSFLKQSGFSNSQLERMVKVVPRLLSGNLEKIIKPKLKLFLDFGICTTDIINIISCHPWILDYSANNRLVPSLSTLMSLFGANEVAKISAVCGKVLTADLNKSLVPNVEFLRKCGISMDWIVQLARWSPRILLYKPQDMKKFVERVDEMGISRTSKIFIHALRLAPSLTGNIKVRIFQELGLSDDDIVATFRKYPLVFGLTKKNLKHKVKTFEEMGVLDGDIAAALRRFPQLFSTSEENLKLKVRTLKEMGFSDGDIRATFKRSPNVFSLSQENIKRTKEVLLENGKYNLSCITRNPVSLTLSIEKRYQPRLEILELLEGKNLIQKWPPFSTFCRMTNQEFHEKYVNPFLVEIGDIYMAPSPSHG